MDNFIFKYLFYIFLILLIYSAFFSKAKRGEKYSKYRSISMIFIFLGSMITIWVAGNNIFGVIDSAFPSSGNGFTIEDYRIVMDIDESNSVNVKEYIMVNFYESGYHGIYKFIPSWLEYTNKDGIKQSRKATISNLKSPGDNYSIEEINGKKRIKIGDQNRTLNKGIYTYGIEYTYDMGPDPYKNFDEFIFHAFGDYWNKEIKNASLTINLPKKFNSQNKIKFFADKYRKKDITSYVNYYVDGNTIYANLSPDYKLTKSLTIDIELPDGYFVNGKNQYNNKSLSICILCILVVAISFTLWFKKGKDLDKAPETLEFYPPENLDAAEIGYLYKKDTGRRLVIALIIELANKGYIKIMESEDKKTLTIVKTNITNINNYIKRKIKIIKLKDYKKRLFNKHKESIKIMNKYFPNNINENIITRDFDEFYEDTKYLIDNGYIKIESDTINEYSEQQLDDIKKKIKDKEFKGKTKMTSNEEIVYNRLFEKSDETILSENYSFYRSFNEIRANLEHKFNDKINDLSAYKLMLITSFEFLLCTILLKLAYCNFEDLNPKFNILYVIAFIANIITLTFAIIMGRKNLYGEKIVAKINGFKNHIELTEKNQIKKLEKENPNYFYAILPYAYILGVSKIWVEKFDKIPTTSINMGNFNFCNIDLIDSLSDSIYVPSSSSSSCGSGGCSSCGGGCSSCGGGGSW